MKIYTRLVLDGSGSVLEEESYHYDGPLALCGGGSKDNSIPETEEERALAEVARAEFDRHQREFVGLENKFIKDAKATEGDYQQATGKAATIVKQDLSKGMAGLQRAPGMPGSSPKAGAELDLTIRGAETAANAESGAARNVQDTEADNLQAAINLGRGQAAGAVRGMGSAATSAAGDAINEATGDWQTANDTGSSVMGAVGMGARGLQKKYASKPGGKE